jgi:hypothetical protein
MIDKRIINNPLRPDVKIIEPTRLEDSFKAKVEKDLATLYIVYDMGNKNGNLSEITLKVLPESLAYSYSPNFQTQNLLGRLSPIYLYTGGSKKSYSFSIDIHEDILDKTKYKNITEFVDQVKSLSYPRLTTSGTLELAKVYFQLGEISGYGIVNTSTKWNKPFRNGRYVMATISFDITIEEKVEQVEVKTIPTKVNDVELIYEYKIASGFTQEEFNDVRALLASGGYSTEISDFTTVGPSDALVKRNEEYARQEFDYQRQRLANIYGIFATADGTQKVKDIAIFKSRDLRNVYKLYTEDNSEAESIKEAKENFLKYMEYYYENVDRTMTPEEREFIENEVISILDSLQVLAEEIVGYGASN